MDKCQKNDCPTSQAEKEGNQTPGIDHDVYEGQGHKKDGEKHSSDGKGHWSGH